MANTGGAGGSAVPNYNDVHDAAVTEDYQATRDRAFLKRALEDGYGQIKLGELAEQNSQSDDVRQFARTLIEDRKQLDTRLEPIAKQLGMGLPKDPSRKDRKLLDKLQRLNGTNFDAEFISAMVRDHEDALKDFHSEADKTVNLPLRDTVKESTAMLSQHLETLATLARNRNIAAAH